MAQLTLPPDPKTVERFWSKVDLDDPADCWLWDAALQTAGYGNVWIEGTNHTAHKVAWVWEHGPVPDGLQLDHLCRNRRCVRPGLTVPKVAQVKHRGYAIANRPFAAIAAKTSPIAKTEKL